MSSSQPALSAASDDRKARLAKLRNLKRKQPTDEVAPPESEREGSAVVEQAEPEEDVSRTILSGRNYDPETRGAKLGFDAAPTLGMEGPTLEEQAAEVEAEARRLAAEEEARDDKGIDLFKLQPKKPNWDLKRDLDKKLEVVNVRTDNAIARLVRERIANAKKEAKPIASEGEDGIEAAGVDGVALVEGLRVREREEEEEERREREIDQEDLE